MAHKKFAMAILAATVFTGCATQEGATEVAFKDETYTPTGTLIPRKKVERDGKMNVVSGEEVQRVLDNVTPTSR